MSITLERITKRYHGNPVVNDVSLEVTDGEFFVLLGPSGSGKSTLLRAIAGLTDIDQGLIRLHGRDVTRVPVRERGVGFVFQNYALFRHMSVAENIEFALSVRKVKAAGRRARRAELLKLVQLEGLGERYPSQLSGGQQQRVAVARALAHNPEVLLLDEPFGALDARIREELRGTIRGVQRELGITAVLVTHDQEEAFALADRIGVMNHGRLLEVGGPHDLYERPATRFAATFLGAANLLLARQGPEGLRVGASLLGTTGAGPAGGRSHEVVAVLRPEDVELAATREAVAGSYLGRAIVESAQFTGALERLRLRPVDDAAAPRIEAARALPAQRELPLAAGDIVEVGARRVHVLPTPLSSFVVHAAHEAETRALHADPLLATLAARMGTSVLTASPGEDGHAAGVAAIAFDADAPARAAALLGGGSNEVLLLTGREALPRHLCIHWMDEAAREAARAVGASLLRHLPGAASCEETATSALPGHLASLDTPLLILGTASAQAAARLLRDLAAATSGIPVLVVYREAAN